MANKEAAMWPGLILENEALRVHIAMYGARLASIEAPDRHGVRDHVLLGFDELNPYFTASSFGAVLGPYANRIAGGRFTLDGKVYRLPRNEGANTLHGGAQRLDKKFWVVESHSATKLKLRTISTGAKHQFPGTVFVHAHYRLEGPALWLELTATTTEPTVLNLSTHPYFNLAGAQALDIADHSLQVFADAYLPTDKAQIPTGEIKPVEGSVFDFREPVVLRERLRADDPQLLQVGGYDHSFVLREPSAEPQLAARIHHPGSGRTLEVHTTQPALQVYTSNKLDGKLPGRGGAYRQSAGLALEPQCFPNAPNQPNFPSTALYPGTTWRALNGFVFTA
jgi:aldose 1-epimerase